MNRLFFFLISSLLVLGSCSNAEQSQTLMASSTAANTTSSDSLFYLLRRNTIVEDSAPLLVLLHGLGSDEADLFSMAESVPGEYVVVSVRAPHAYGSGYAWYNVAFSDGKLIYDIQEQRQSVDQLMALTDRLCIQMNLDKHRVYFSGFSQGAIMSLDLGLRFPEKIKGIAPLSGRLMPETEEAVHPNAAKTLDVFLAHGKNDRMISIEEGRACRDFLLSKGLNPEYHEYPIEHSISSEEMMDWVAWLSMRK